VNSDIFTLPVAFDLIAVFFFGLTGCLAAIRRGYDIVGVISLAAICAIGGAIIRDGVFLQSDLPAAIKDPRYLYAILVSVVVGRIVGERIERFGRFLAVMDAIGLGAYAVFGTQKALLHGIDPLVAVFIGVINAMGGGLIRDIITREEPLVFKPGQFYILAAFVGATCFVVLAAWTPVNSFISGIIASVACVAFRLLAIRLNWKTKTFYAPKLAKE
jgi:uncharacterized membrane protein YeiH